MINFTGILNNEILDIIYQSCEMYYLTHDLLYIKNIGIIINNFGVLTKLTSVKFCAPKLINTIILVYGKY